MLQLRITRIFSIAGSVVTVSILGYMVYQGRGLLFTYDWQIDWLSVLFAFGMIWVTFMIMVLVWVVQMRTIGSQLPTITHINNYVVTHLVRRLPGPFWYIAGRGYLYHQQGESVRVVTVVSGLELLLLTISGIFLAFTLGGINLYLPPLYRWPLLAILSVSMVSAHPGVVQWMLRQIGRVEAPRLGYLQLSLWFLAYLFAWLSSGFMFYWLLHGFIGLSQKYVLFTIYSWTLIGSLSNLIFFLPTNMGFTEIGLSLLLSQILPPPVAAVAALSVRVAVTAFDVILAGLWLMGAHIWRCFFQKGISPGNK